MNLAALAIRHRITTLVAVLLLVVMGWQAYHNVGWLEDPEFSIKLALVVTQYPGASPEEVELQVTDPWNGPSRTWMSWTMCAASPAPVSPSSMPRSSSATGPTTCRRSGTACGKGRRRPGAAAQRRPPIAGDRRFR